jgi:hypothetical protein
LRGKRSHSLRREIDLQHREWDRGAYGDEDAPKEKARRSETSLPPLDHGGPVSSKEGPVGQRGVF